MWVKVIKKINNQSTHCGVQAPTRRLQSELCQSFSHLHLPLPSFSSCLYNTTLFSPRQPIIQVLFYFLLHQCSEAENSMELKSDGTCLYLLLPFASYQVWKCPYAGRVQATLCAACRAFSVVFIFFVLTNEQLSRKRSTSNHLSEQLSACNSAFC